MAKKQPQANEPSADVPASAKKKRRVFMATPTLRDQTTKGKENGGQKKSRVRRVFGSKVFAPFRAIGRFIRRIWNSKVFTPVRVVVRWIGKIVWPKYFRNSWKELRLVIWPDFKTTWRLTFAVILFGMVFGLFIAGIDVLLEKLFREVLLG